MVKVIRNVFIIAMLLTCVYILFLCALDMKIPIGAIVIFIVSTAGSFISCVLFWLKAWVRGR